MTINVRVWGGVGAGNVDTAAAFRGVVEVCGYTFWLFAPEGGANIVTAPNEVPNAAPMAE